MRGFIARRERFFYMRVRVNKVEWSLVEVAVELKVYVCFGIDYRTIYCDGNFF